MAEITPRENQTTNVSQELGRRRGGCRRLGCGIVLAGERESGFAQAGQEGDRHRHRRHGSATPASMMVPGNFPTCKICPRPADSATWAPASRRKARWPGPISSTAPARARTASSISSTAIRTSSASHSSRPPKHCPARDTGTSATQFNADLRASAGLAADRNTALMTFYDPLGQRHSNPCSGGLCRVKRRKDVIHNLLVHSGAIVLHCNHHVFLFRNHSNRYRPAPP